MEYADGLVYATSGRVIEPETSQLVGTFLASGAVEPVPELARVYFVTGSTPIRTLRAFDQDTFQAAGSVEISGVSGTVDDLVRASADGLAFRSSGGQLVLLRNELLRPPLDTDRDGCTDAQELGPNEALGGRRDPTSLWDFMDVPTGAPPLRDRVVSGGDIGAVVARFGAMGDPGGNPRSPVPAAPAYHTAFDRAGVIAGGDPWDLRPADGAIGGGDVGATVIQFGHNCR
jgi:hypothetical protein